MGLEALSDADLAALQTGDISKVSDAGLAALQGGSVPAAPKTGMDLMRDKSVPLGERLGSQGLPMDGKSPAELLDQAAYWAGGKVTDMTGLPMAGTAVNTAMQAGVPVGLGGKVGKFVSSKGRALAEKLMRGSMVPTAKDLQLGKAQRAAQTFLDRLELPTEGGVGRLKSQAMGIGNQVDNELSRVGGTVDKGQVTSYIQPEITKLEQRNMLPTGPRSQMEGVYDEAVSNPLVPNAIPVERAQQFKQTLHQDLRNKYGTLSEGSEAAKKALARGLRLELEKAAPGVKPLNAEASELWNAINVAERRALMEANKDLVGFSPLAGNPVTAGIMLASRRPMVKALLAHGANLSTKPIPSKFAARLGLGAASLDEPEQ